MSENVGFFLLYRSIWECEALRDNEERLAWIWLLSEAAYGPRTVIRNKILIDLDAGEIAHSLRFCAATWGWSKDEVHSFFQRLQKHKMISTARSTTSATPSLETQVIKINEYNKFQTQYLRMIDGRDSKVDKRSRQRVNQSKQVKQEIERKKGATDVAPPTKAPSTSKGIRLPSDWTPAATTVTYGLGLGFDRASIEEMAESMRLWAGANGNRAVARKSNWEIAFQGWMRRERDKRKGPTGTGPSSATGRERERAASNREKVREACDTFIAAAGGRGGQEPRRLLRPPEPDRDVDERSNGVSGEVSARGDSSSMLAGRPSEDRKVSALISGSVRRA